MSDTSESADDAGETPAGGDDAAAAVDAEEVRHVAELARVRLADDEVDAFAEQFAEILDPSRRSTRSPKPTARRSSST